MSAPAKPSSKAPTASKDALQKAQPGQPPRKKRVVRRRGRGQNEIGSDDEIEREAASDSDSDDDDDHSSLDSATDDSDTEPVSEDAPSHPHSPPAAKVGVAGEMNGGVATFFASTSTWSEMVADETENGPSGLPVIDFAEFNGAPKVPARRNKKSKARKHNPPSASEQPAQQPAEIPEDKPKQETQSPGPHPRKFGQTARQAYQQRLETDPSYVPKVGGFWGHDDRLMDKDLRSLSGWWRGKWSGHGGRGRGFGMRGGARGGFDQHEARLQDLPPVEREWTHDGFEEMKRKDDQRTQHQQQPESLSGSSRGGFRGGRGGGFGGRGRGGFGKRFSLSPGSSARALSPANRQNRVWYAMRPEATWSKQSDAYLFFDNGSYGRNGQKPGVRVRLPGDKVTKFVKPNQQRQAQTHAEANAATVSGSDNKGYQYVVRLPQHPKAAQQAEKAPSTPAEATQPDEVLPVEVPPVVAQATTPATSAEVDISQPQLQPTQALPDASVISQLGQLSLEPQASNPERLAKTEEAVLRKPGITTIPDEKPTSQDPLSASEQRPALPPLQTVFTPPPPPPPPVAQPSPAYGSPYNYPQTLPPGIALNHQGMPYELATGRPVYLQAPPLYNPRPMHYPPPGLGYMPGHVRHPSAVSPDYLAQPQSSTPPMNGFVDPATGVPIFSLPRSVRIEIRAPDGNGVASSPPSNSNGKALVATHTPSKLRTEATSFEPRPNGEYYPTLGTPSDGNTLPPSYEATNGTIENEHQQQQPMGNMMQYHSNPYQQPYYYPEPYGYQGYMDMSQGGQYDMYNMDQAQQVNGYY
ncbi:hypothetical protein FA15DRAFT_755426 [Coprinopsis marcescibilis]|uniref:Btz domain-containing protein n=1 Tax=Coprinopsis marcescibilis TaxID=230819 RepID=A0A5C3LCC2_COPMA|nr:hypothetical protein FA15DRAFT_755426 [Coprinopsis marcescibilis]